MISLSDFLQNNFRRYLLGNKYFTGSSHHEHRVLGSMSPSTLCLVQLREEEVMNLLKTYSKLIIKRNKFNYLLIILSIIAIYIVVSVLMVYIDNILILSSEFMFPSFRYLYISIRTVFLIGGITFISSQYYNIMNSGMRDYCILKSLGATKHVIQFLITIQMIFLILLTIPIGLYSGYILSSMILNSLSKFTINNNTKELLDSTNTFYLIAGVACCLIISIGIYLERGIRKMPVSSILTDHVSLCKDVGIL